MKGDDRVEVPLHRVAHARTGDKGNRINIAVFCFRDDAFAHLAEQLTEDRVLACFSHRHPSRVQRYALPQLAAFNFVIDDVLGGGVNNSLFLDRHGKGLSSLLLTLPVWVPAACIAGT